MHRLGLALDFSVVGFRVKSEFGRVALGSESMVDAYDFGYLKFIESLIFAVLLLEFPCKKMAIILKDVARNPARI